MAGNLKHCITLLQDNEEGVKREAQKILLKLCTNILNNPQELRFRKIQLANATVSSKLLPASGAIECLFEAGFIENDDGFLLPTSASLTGLKELCGLLQNLSEPVKSQMTCVTSSSQKLSTVQAETTIEKEYHKNSFFVELSSLFKKVLKYEDPHLQNKVRLILPLEKLQINAMEKLREIQKQVKINKVQDDTVIEDLLLSELLYWFKFKFFKWVNSPACTNCMGESCYDRSVVSSSPQISRVEIHKCKNCGNETKFPRYSDPECLLHTRQGRCGEWANCFTLICRTLGFDARLVYDKTDHVWTEVWSDAHNKWIHADACENAMDKPLLYEKGWGKKLSYIIAISRDGLQDVTWRYTRKYTDVLRRRILCSETALLAFINKLNMTQRNSEEYSSARKKFVMKREVIDLAGMLNAPPGSQKPSELTENNCDYSGRTSGSLVWRVSRGEVQNTTYTPTHWNIQKGISSFEFSYSIISDTYTIRDITNNTVLEKRQKWQSGVELLEGGVFKKEEPDWKMIYLARSPGLIFGKIMWTFVVEDSANMCVDSVRLEAKSTSFNGAIVKWEIKGIISANDKAKEESKVVYTVDGKNFETKDLRGAMKISVSALLSGGEGESAWQHAQLFRQSLNSDSEEPSMIISIDLLNKLST